MKSQVCAISKAANYLAALWWGSLTTLGFFVVPMLFVHLPSKALAGNMAARLFEVQTWVSVACGLLLLFLLRPKKPKNDENMPVAGVFIDYSATIFIALGVLLALLITFGVSPHIVARENLMLWHSVGTVMYLAQWLCAGGAMWKLLR